MFLDARSGFARLYARAPAHRPLLLCAASAALFVTCALMVAAPSPSFARTRRCTRHHRRHRACRRPHRAVRAAARPSAPCGNATTPATGASVQAMDAAVVCLVNQQRTLRGLPSLVDQSQLQTAAQHWSDWMVTADQFTHGADFSGRILAAGYAFRAAGENIATGVPTPTAVVRAWMRSADHCRNILTPTFRNVGIGVSPHPVSGSASGPSTWTEDFGLPMTDSAPSQNWGPANGCPY
jgi:uncharacterized protein YkwD